ncbi:haloacid dehalogenase-like hydrolase-domain-containing protein [Aspergillus lucknowensis]|uniref:Haloacid dehalogenase-like hydrolase-domain-containing protein n=1 Tax=Aspergillus lucknowensis TaxID=176173 RepID=A0ABR4L630_9EURO
MVSFADSQRPPALAASAADEIPGKGMKGSFPLIHQPSSILDVIVGNEALMLDHEITISSANVAILTAWKRDAKSVVLAGTRVREGARDIEKALSMMLAVAVPVRPEAKEVMQALRNRGISVGMISGDNPTTAHAVGKKVGISLENIIAGVLPEQKAEKIRYLQKTMPTPSKRRWFNWGKESKRSRPFVAMVGDVINDSPTLTVPDVGIALSGPARRSQSHRQNSSLYPLA